MRIAFVTLSEKEFNHVLSTQNNVLTGSGFDDINIFRAKRYLQGSGFFDFIKGVGKFLFPLAKKYVAPSLNDFGRGVIKDLVAGENIKSSVKKRGKKGLKQIGTRILEGRGMSKGVAKMLKAKSRKRKSRAKKATKNKKNNSIRGCGQKRMKARRKKNSKSKKKNKKKSKKIHFDIFS